MDTNSKKSRSNTRKTISFLAKTSLILMGEPITTPSKKAVPSQKQLTSKNHSIFFKTFLFILKLPLFALIAIFSTKHKEESDSTKELLTQDPSLFDSTPPCKRPPHER